MLVLTRRVGETLHIGNDVTVTVPGVNGNQIRVGVIAPKEVAVHREEVYERIQMESAMGSESQPEFLGMNAAVANDESAL